MRSRLVTALAAGAAGCVIPALVAGPSLSTPGHPSNAGRSFTMAVYGDAPYGTSPQDTSQTVATPHFIDAVNADPDVTTVVHVGDIHSGKQYCTEGYDRTIAGLWSDYADPVVYTPGDNEWTDCHKPAEGGGTYNKITGQIDYAKDANGNLLDYAGGNPVANLDLVRSIFFPGPGATLGSGTLRTTSQATAYDPAHPEDAAYVENVRWQRKGFLFVTVNIPGGSNNDADPWYGAPVASAEQTQERTQRTAADLRWLDQSFAVAQAVDAQGVVVISQADMWDVDGKSPAHLTNYEALVGSLASHTTALAKPVLLFEGDSHAYRSDNPLVPGAPCATESGACANDAYLSHPGYNVPDFHRVVVHGSTFPLEWLKLTVTPGAHGPTTATSLGPFSWSRMPVG